jgi:hypothetical protein
MPERHPRSWTDGRCLVLQLESDFVMATPTFDRDTILQVVTTWQREEQLALVEAILRHTISTTPTGARTEPLVKPDTSPLTGIFTREGQTPPDDATVARWLEEHRMEKYGD